MPRASSVSSAERPLQHCLTFDPTLVTRQVKKNTAFTLHLVQATGLIQTYSTNFNHMHLCGEPSVDPSRLPKRPILPLSETLQIR